MHAAAEAIYAYGALSAALARHSQSLRRRPRCCAWLTQWTRCTLANAWLACANAGSRSQGDHHALASACN